MKKVIFSSLSARNITGLFALLLVVSCSKAVDSSSDSLTSALSSGATETPGSTPADNYATCKLRGIVFREYDYNGTIQRMDGVFTYYAGGNLFSLTYKVGGISWESLPRYNYFNDSKGRLKEERLSYVNGTDVKRIRKFGYNSNNQITTDTTITPTVWGDYVQVATLTYDSYGRIVKEIVTQIQTINGAHGEGQELPPPSEFTYTYDNRGNLVTPGWPSAQYDNKVSLFRSHPAFMFLFRNYSRNNPSAQTTYNSRGLPLKWTLGNDKFFESKEIDKIAYDCK